MLPTDTTTRGRQRSKWPTSPGMRQEALEHISLPPTTNLRESGITGVTMPVMQQATFAARIAEGTHTKCSECSDAKRHHQREGITLTVLGWTPYSPQERHWSNGWNSYVQTVWMARRRENETLLWTWRASGISASSFHEDFWKAKRITQSKTLSNVSQLLVGIFPHRSEGQLLLHDTTRWLGRLEEAKTFHKTEDLGMLDEGQLRREMYW